MLTVVGCSGSYPGPDSPASCYLLETDDADGRTWRVLLDLGNGALGALHRHVDPLTVDAVLLSHLHADHCLDLCGYYVMRKYHPQGPPPQIPVHGPSGVAERMARAYDLDPDPGMGEEFDFREYDGAFTVGPFEVQPVRVEHPVEAYALRIAAGGAVLAYSGDTAACEGVDRVAAGADLLLCEASFRDGDDNPPGIHLTGVEAGRVAADGGSGRLVLTHVPPWFDPDAMLGEARTTFEGPIELATPGAVYEL
ncbi:MBL fold metallo-hydrolase [Nocardioides marinquilinus]|uniref:MBL fold metallo-hydrolase n=1 Tax=Nocardioides marinquilinus TaxID=1210400 RepID=A0ABP9PNR6_9ACTN